METHSNSDDANSGRTPSQAEARDTLAALNEDGRRLAERVVTPWWYQLGLGAIVAVMSGSQALPAESTMLSIVLLVGAILALPVLSYAYTARYGVSISEPAGPRSRRLLFAAIAVLVVSMVAALAVKFAEISPWWGLVPAAFGFVMTVVLGRRYDDALRQEISDARPARS